MLPTPEDPVDKTERITEMFSLRRTPIKIGFFAEGPPPGVERWGGGPAPAGCFFWARAMEGKTFYTVPEDHYNCAIGSCTRFQVFPRFTEMLNPLSFATAIRSPLVGSIQMS